MNTNPTRRCFPDRHQYPWHDWTASVASCTTLDGAATANRNWSAMGWTMDYMSEHSNACQARRDCEAAITLMRFFLPGVG